MPAEFTGLSDAVLTLPQEFMQEHSDWPNKVGFKVVKTITIDGVEQAIESNLLVATKAA